MELSVFNYSRKEGWSVKDFPKLDSKKTLVLVFGAPEFIDKKKLFMELSNAYPRSHIVGCSTAGEIINKRVNDQSLSVAVIRFKKVDIKSYCEEIHAPEDSYQVGKNIATKLLDPDLRFILILSVGLNVNGTALVKGLREILPSKVITTGGLAGDGSRFETTWVLTKQLPCTTCIMGVGFYGDDLILSHGSKGGWDIFGPERIITSSKDNVLYKIDEQPALELYKRYLGARAQDLPSSGLLFPLSIRKNEHDINPLVRTILGVDEKKQSMTFAGDVPQGWICQLMRANFDRIIAGATDAANIAIGELTNQQPPILCIAISCVGRRLVLGERSEEEVEATFELLPEHSQQIGFYSYGEISPSGFANCDLHNQTMTITLLGEK